MRFMLASALTLALAHAISAQPLPALVATTDALSPADERKALVVPAEFEVQLVASEPDIQKPMQMAFDAKGRLWVTTSYHYPFAAEKGKGTDKLFVLSDFDETGKAKTVQTFAADLNIPIGILPLPDCNSCIVSSVGEILKLTDADGDGKYDKKEVLFTGFGSRDTHGMYNSYTLLPDGWVYACHGFNNDSKVKGKDGHEVVMQSGNTFRFRPDGSRIEVVSRGQVNPFGMTIDPWFNIYTADCHSKPMTQNIPGATYESFNSTSDPLGFGPVMFGYDPGGTGLCGLSWYDAEQFPASYKGMMFLGNVVTSRVNMSKIEWTGSTPRAVQQPDFVTSKDPWFRPVDLKLGPDGAIYISDFYNKIIGHYEVDLKHPQRDKGRGRLWRVVWKGKDGTAPLEKPRADFTKATDTELLTDLASPNMTVRMLAGNQVLHRVRSGKEFKPEDAKVLELLQAPATASGVGGWLCFAEEAKSSGANYGQLVEHAKGLPLKPDQFGTLMVRAMASREKWNDAERKAALDVLKSFDAPRLRRATVDAMAAHPHQDFVRPLVEVIQKCPAGDTHLLHAARIALRNQLLAKDVEGVWGVVRRMKDPADTAVVAGVMLGVPTERAAEFLSEIVPLRHPDPQLPAYAEHIGRYGRPVEHAGFLQSSRQMLRVAKDEKELTLSVQLIRQLLRGMQAGGHKLAKDDASHFRFATEAKLPLLKSDPAAARLWVETVAALPTVADDKSREALNGVALAELLAIGKADVLADDVRGPALDAASRIEPMRLMGLLVEILNDPNAGVVLKERVLVALASVPSREARGEVNVALKGVPYRVALAVALNMAATRVGGEELLGSVRGGFLPARVLQEKPVIERLRASGVPDLDKQLAELTKGLPPADQKIADLIKARSAALPLSKVDKEVGAKLYTKHCGACHQIGGMGGKVGPQLDGIGLRGAERLLEDVLDPNRNVDAAFRARILNLKDGTTKSGLMLRIEGEVLVMADDQGKEYRVPTKDIDVNRETALSPMPANFGETIAPDEFNHLMAYLLAQTVNPPKK